MVYRNVHETVTLNQTSRTLKKSIYFCIDRIKVLTDCRIPSAEAHGALAGERFRRCFVVQSLSYFLKPM